MALRRVVYFSRALTGYRFVSQKILRLPRNTRLTPDIASMARIAGRHDGRIQIAIGECKTRQPITNDDIDNLKSVAAAFPKNRFDVFIILAKLIDFTHDEINYAATLNCEFHRRVILLTARELKPYFLYERTASELNVEKTAVSFEDMANVTHQIYFQTPVKIT